VSGVSDLSARRRPAHNAHTLWRRSTTISLRRLHSDQSGVSEQVDTCYSLLGLDPYFGSQAVTKAKNPERNFIATFFYKNNKTFKLTDQFGAALATALFVNGLISIMTETTDEPIVWVIVMVISGIAMANVISNSINRNSALIDSQYKKMRAIKNNDFAKIFLTSFTKTGAHCKQLLDFDITGTMFSHPCAYPANSQKCEMLRLLSKKAVFLFGQDKLDSTLRFVVSNAQVIAEYSPISIAVLYLTRDELIIYSVTLDIIEGELQTEDIYHIRLQDIVDVSSTSSIKRMKSLTNTEVIRKYQKATNTSANEIAYRQQKIRITKIDGLSLLLPVGSPEYSSIRQGALDGNAYTDYLARISHDIIRRINDARAGLRSD
jgi:hypothetical protein